MYNISIWMFPKIGGKPPKWMVKIMENPIKMDDLGVPLFLETPILKFSHQWPTAGIKSPGIPTREHSD